MLRTAIVVTVLGAAACGGGNKQAQTTPPGGDGDDVAVDDDGGGGDVSGGDEMVPPEKMDAIQRTLDRRRAIASRCLTDAVEAGEAKKNARGKVTVNFVVTTGGKARDVSIASTSLDSEMVQQCVIELVASTTFPELPRDLDWSYTFAFEAF